MKCPYHNIDLKVSKENPRKVLICPRCKSEKNLGRDGIFHVDDLKERLNQSHNVSSKFSNTYYAYNSDNSSDLTHPFITIELKSEERELYKKIKDLVINNDIRYIALKETPYMELIDYYGNKSEYGWYNGNELLTDREVKELRSDGDFDLIRNSVSKTVKVYDDNVIFEFVTKNNSEYWCEVPISDL